MIDLLVDLKNDYCDYIKGEVGYLKSLGFLFPKRMVDSEYEISEYFNLLERIPSQFPRRIYKAKGFSCPKDSKNGLCRLEEDIIAGNSLFKYLSKRIFQADYSDGMKFDFGISHFHLGTVPDASCTQLVKRTANVLYAVYTDDAFYFLAVDKHGRWNDLRLIEIIAESFPELLKMHEINNIKSLQPGLTEKQRKTLRENHVNTFIHLDGKLYSSPGGGVSSNGFSTNATFKFIRQMSFLMRLEEQIKIFFASNHSLEFSLPDVSRLELHYATFSKPMILFDTKLQYKFEIDWDQKNIIPIRIYYVSTSDLFWKKKFFLYCL